MLNPEYRYIALDFETTGLDTERDEPIQIGIVCFDDKGILLESFQSLLQPKNTTQNLQTLVGLITGLSVDQLKKAPFPEEILADIQHFFGAQTVIIGHNIAFDTAFLKRFFPTLEWRATIDTFPLAQTLIHYAPSYALEVLGERLCSTSSFMHYVKLFGCEYNAGATFHDALFDAKQTAALFFYLIERIALLLANYPLLQSCLQRTATDFFYLNPKYFLLKNYRYQPSDLPALKKIAPSHTKILESEYDFHLADYQHGERYRCDHLDLKLLLQAFAKHQKLILSFSNPAKLNIVKNLLNDMGLKNLGFIKPEQTIQRSALEEFVHKSNINKGEFLFLLKYFSHIEQGLGVLDLNSKENFEVYTAIRDKRAVINYPLVLTTHGGLYSLLENDKAYSDYGIVFFDTEWWYKGYHFYFSRPYDPLYTLNYIEMLNYKYHLALEYTKITPEEFARFEQFHQDFLMLVGILGKETKAFFTHTSAEELTLNPIIGNVAFYQTNKLLDKLKIYESFLSSFLDQEEFTTLWNQVLQMYYLFQEVITVEKKMYDKSGFYFLYSHEVSFINREEFLELFSKHPTIFLTYNEQQSKALLPERVKTPKTQLTFPNLSLVSLQKRIASLDFSQAPNAIVFILSVKKLESKEIFESLVEKGFNQEFTLLAENITGGSGKNIFKAQQQGKTIIIGGYAFLLQLFAQKVAIFDIIVYNNKGKQQKVILQDIIRYGGNLLDKRL